MKLGIIGLGRWGSRVYPEYIKLQKEKKVDYVFSCDTQKPADFKDYHDMLGHVDGVHICLPNKYHYQVALDVLQSGTHCLVEKPMTLSKTQAHHLIEVASEQGLILQVGYILRFANVLRKAKELYQSGVCGQLYYGAMRWTALMASMDKTDIVWDLLPHPLDIMHFITGRYPNDNSQVMERCYRREELGEIAFINLDYDDFFMNVWLSWLDPVKRRDVWLYGSDGALWFDAVSQRMKVFKGDVVEDVQVVSNDTIYHEALNFIRCLSDGHNRFNSHIVGLQNTEFIEELLKK